MEPETRSRGQKEIMPRFDSGVGPEEILSELRDGNPFYSIIVAGEIAMRYSIKSPLRGATGPDKPILSIQKLNTLTNELRQKRDSLAADELLGLFEMYSRRALNEGNELVGEYEEDSYEVKTSDFEKLSPSAIVFSGEDGMDEFEEEEQVEDDEVDNVDNNYEEDDDRDPSEDEVDNIQ